MQVGSQSFIGNLGTLAGVYKTPALHADVTCVFTNTNPVRPYRGNGRPEAAYVIERLVDLAADKLGIDPVELRRRNTIPPNAMPFKTGLTFTYDCGEFEKNMDMALDDGRRRRLSGPPCRSRASAASCAGSVSPTPSRRAAAPSYEGAEIRFDRSGAVDAVLRREQSRPGPRDRVQADRRATGSVSIRTGSNMSHDDTDQVFFGDGTGGSRSATIGGAAVLMATDKIKTKATAIAAHVMKVAPEDVRFEDGMFSSQQDQPDHDAQGCRARRAQPGQAAEGHGGRPDRDRGLQSRRSRTIPTAAMSARSRSTRRPAW